MKRLWLFLLTGVLAVAGCSSSKTTQPPAPVVSVSVSPTTATLSIGATQQFTATVTGSANQAVTWSVSGTGCTGGQCGTVTGTGLYSAPDTPPTSVTVTATSVADTSKSASASVTVNTVSNSGFSGQYAFYFTGFETQDNSPAAIAGSITANGSGGITSGVLDLNRLSGYDSASCPTQPCAITSGTYLFGADNRGRLVLNLPTSPTPTTITIRFAMNAPSGSPAVSTKGRLLAFSPRGTVGGLLGVGVIKRQDSTAFCRQTPSCTNPFNGAFAFGISGNLGAIIPPGTDYNRFAGVGQLVLDPTGTVTSGSVDTNTAGSLSSTTTVAGTGTAIDSTNGRGTQVLAIGGPPPTTVNISFYVVSASEAFFVDMDARTVNSSVAAGSMVKQTGGPYGATSLNAATILSQSAQTTQPTQGTMATIGQLVGDGAGNIPGTLDQNDGGVVSGPTAVTWTYAIAGSAGRGTMGPGGTGYIFYLTAPNNAFVMDTTPQVGFGSLEAQTGGPFTTASLTGQYFAGTNSMATCDCAGVSGYARMTPGTPTGSFVGNRDRRVAGSDPFPREDWSGIYAVPSGATGRGTLNIAIPTPTENAIIYIISPSKFVMIVVAPTSVTAPVVTVFEK